MKKNLRGSFNVFSNSARQLEVPLNQKLFQLLTARVGLKGPTESFFHDLNSSVFF